MKTVKVRSTGPAPAPPGPSTLEERFGEQLVIHYQPVVDAKTGSLTGFEALLRAVGAPEPGAYPKATVESLGGEAGSTIHKLDRWIVEQALQDGEKLRAAGIAVPLHINVSVAEINDAVPDAFDEWLKGLGERAAHVILEVVESSHIANAARAHELVDVCHQIGMQIAFDNFGMGSAASISLQELRPDVVKLDRHLVAGLLHDTHTRSAGHTLIKLAHNLHVRIVAEGVDGTALWEWLRLADCDEIQGFVVSRPLPIDDVPKWYAAWTELMQEAAQKHLPPAQLLQSAPTPASR